MARPAANPFVSGTFTVDANARDTAVLNYVDERASIVTTQTVAGTTYTVTAADLGTHLIFTSASAVTVTWPAQSVTAMAVGSWVAMTQQGVGQVTIVGGSGTTNMTVNVSSGHTAASRTQFSKLIAEKVGSVNSINVNGDLA